MFGIPFLIKVKQGEPFTSVRDRIRQCLDVNEKEFEKVIRVFTRFLKLEYF